MLASQERFEAVCRGLAEAGLNDALRSAVSAAPAPADVRAAE